jgi:hypothetical protein
MEKLNIDLPAGGNLEVHVTPDFITKIQLHFDLISPNEVTDDHIRMFIYGSVKNAVDKAEKNR